MNITISPIGEVHAEGFHRCLDAVAREKRYLAQIEALPLERIQEFVRESVTNGAAQFVALEGNAVVGWCDIFPGWAHAVQHCGTLGMGVLAAYRGRGIGKQLLSATLAKAKANGMTRIELEVRADNSRAIELYRRMGFILETRKRHALRFEGVYHDAYQMSLLYEPDF
jgi:putative acetyltransferase